MMGEQPKHPVIYVLADGTSVDKLVKRISPDRLKASCPKGSKFVVRFGPRTKKWEVYNLRKYISNPSMGQFYKAAADDLDDREGRSGWLCSDHAGLILL